MLVEFSVENFRSIRDRQTLSMVAGRSAAKNPLYAIETGREDIPSLLRLAAIFGANASGKTTLLTALSSLKTFIRGSALERLPRQQTISEPFALSEETMARPSGFEISFIVGDILYEFGCLISRERVAEEWLNASSSSGRTRKLYSRVMKTNESRPVYAWEIDLPGAQEEQVKVWRDATRDNALFLSTAVQLNAALLRPAYDWFAKSAWLASPPAWRFPLRDATRQMLFRERGQYLQAVLEFLNASDLRIVDIAIDAIELGTTSNTETRLRVRMGHQNDQGKVTYLDEHEESAGTQRLFSLAGRFLSAWQLGHLLLVDELDASLHPLAAANLIRMFSESPRNNAKAQMIFSSHNPALLRPDVLHRDQIWFTERDHNQATRLTPLSDFEARNDTAREDRYLAGRYGGIPLIRLRLGDIPPDFPTPGTGQRKE